MAARTKQSPARGAESERYAEVLGIAADLFARKGYTTTTVRDVADAAGILSGSLYHHFESKEAMADEILTSFLNDMRARYDEVLALDLAPRDAFGSLASASLRAIDDHQAAIVLYQKDGGYLAELPRFAYLRDAGRRFEEAWVGVIERGIASGDFRSSTDPRLAYRFIRATLWTVARWYRPEGAFDIEQITEQYLTILLDGLATPGRGRRRRVKAASAQG